MSPRKKELVRMDEGSSEVVRQLVNTEIGCNHPMNSQIESGAFAFLRHGLFCKAMFANLSEDAPPVDAQCVVMGGDVTICPIYSADNRKALLELRKKVAASLTYSEMGNFSTVSGSELDKS